MEMTNGEIVTSYKQAKHKAQQIGILAELNRCSNKKIIEILLNGGIPLKSFNRFKDLVPVSASNVEDLVPASASNAEDTEAEEYEPEEVQEEQEDEEETVQTEEQLPSDETDKGIYELFVPIHNKVKALREEREKIDNELAALNMYLNRIEDLIAGRNDENATV